MLSYHDFEKNKKEQTRWTQLIAAAPLDLAVFEGTDAELDQFELDFNALGHHAKIMAVFDHIIKGVRFNSFVLQTDLNQEIYDALLPVYMSPLGFRYEGMSFGESLSLNFRQFGVLHDIMSDLISDPRVPMNIAPPEYWYMFHLCQIPIPSMGKIAPGYRTSVNLFEPLLKASRFTSVCSDVRLTSLDGISWSNGRSTLPRFKIPDLPFTLALSLYQAWPSYWESFNTFSVPSFIGDCVRRAVLAVQMSSEVAPIVAFRQYPVNRTALVLDDTSFAAAKSMDVSCAEVTESVSLDEFPRVDKLDTYEPVIMSCECGDCGVGANDYLLPILGDTGLTDLLDTVVLERPFFFEDPPPLTFYDQFDCDGNYDTKTSVTVCLGEWDVLANGKIWLSYLQVDSLVAKYCSGDIYKRSLKIPELIKYDSSSTIWRLNGGKKLPKTFHKFAWIYLQLGWVVLGAGGKYPVNRFISINPVDLLEFSAAPYGNLAALIEPGLVKRAFISTFAGESHPDCPYMNQDGLVCDIIANLDTKTDIRSIAKSFWKLRGGSTGSQGLLKFGLIVYDIPLHRNSTSAYSMKTYGQEQKKRKFVEFVDDAPLGKADAQVKLIDTYMALNDMFMGTGGTMIVKILEFWTPEVVSALVSFFKFFKKIRAYRNPYSKPSSKEVYFILEGYHQGEFKDHDLVMFLYDFSNKVLSMLTHNLVQLAHLYAGELKMNRSITCRMSLKAKKAIDGFPTVKYMPVFFSFAKQYRNDLVVNDQERALVLAGYCAEEAKLLFKFYKSFVRVVLEDPLLVPRVLKRLKRMTEPMKFSYHDVMMMMPHLDLTFLGTLDLLLKNDSKITD